MSCLGLLGCDLLCLTQSQSKTCSPPESFVEKSAIFYQHTLLCAHTVGAHKPTIIQVGLEE